MTSIDLESGLEGNPVARQKRHRRHAASDGFAPEVEVPGDAIRALMTPSNNFTGEILTGPPSPRRLFASWGPGVSCCR